MDGSFLNLWQPKRSTSQGQKEGCEVDLLGCRRLNSHIEK